MLYNNDETYICQIILKKIFGILLLFCLVAPTVFTYTWLKYQQKVVRKEVKHRIIAGLHRDDLVLLKFTEKEKKQKLVWKHSKEFCFDTQMYDVVETEKHGDTTYYFCWWDHNETRLSKQLEDMWQVAWRRNSQRRNSQKRIIKFYKSLFFQVSEKDVFLASEIKTTLPNLIFLPQKGYTSPPFRPPNLA